MATISPRHDQDDNLIGWQAIIRQRGFPSQTKTFRTKRDAEAWAKVTESEMVWGVFVPAYRGRKDAVIRPAGSLCKRGGAHAERRQS